jgi:hypothetical protein
MPLIQNDHVIQQVSAAASHPAFRNAVLSRHFDDRSECKRPAEQIEIALAVSPILQVIEVDPELGAGLSVEDIKSSRYRIALN